MEGHVDQRPRESQLENKTESINWHPRRSVFLVCSLMGTNLYKHLTILSSMQNLTVQTQGAHRSKASSLCSHKEGDSVISLQQSKPSIDVMEEASYAKNSSEADVPFSGPLQVSGSSGFSWAKRRSNDSSVRSRSRSSSRSLVFEPSIGLPTRSNLESKRQENGELRNGSRTNSKGQNSYDNAKRAAIEHWSQLERPDSFDASDSYHSQDLSLALYLKEEMALKRMNVVSPKLR